MTTPALNPYEALINAIEGMGEHTVEQTESIKELSSAVLGEAAARDRKVEELQRSTRISQRLTGVLVAGIVILLGIAGLNLINTTRTNGIAQNAQQTNELLVGCFTPGSDCQKQSFAQQKAQNDQQRQTTFVLFVCSRLNPTDPNNPDPTGNTAKLVACVKTYYPDFKLPAKAN